MISKTRVLGKDINIGKARLHQRWGTLAEIGCGTWTPRPGPSLGPEIEVIKEAGSGAEAVLRHLAAWTYVVLKLVLAQNCPEGLLKHNSVGILGSGCLGWGPRICISE